MLSSTSQYSADTQLTTLKGSSPTVLRDYLLSLWQRLTPSQLHQIRQQVLSCGVMKETRWMSLQTSARHSHLDYQFTSPQQAFFLITCRQTYHSWHLDYILDQITTQGQLFCPMCDCQAHVLAHIIPDAFYSPLFANYAIHGETKVLLNRRKKVSPIDNQRALQEPQLTVVGDLVVQAQPWQFAKDDDLPLTSPDQLVASIGLAEKRGAAATKLLHELYEADSPKLINLVCFESQVRIRNPLMHRDCLPSRHNHRIYLYSFEQVYQRVCMHQKGPVRCPFPGCSNQLTSYNFEEAGVVVATLRLNMYKEDNANVIGLFFGGVYLVGWHSAYLVQRIAAHLGLPPHSNKVQQELNQLQLKTRQLVTTASLQAAAARISKLRKQLAQKDLLRGTTGLKRSGWLPVRCHKCASLQYIDLLEVVLNLREGKCPICAHPLKKKPFYELFYLDLELLQLMFTQTDAPYNPCSSLPSPEQALGAKEQGIKSRLDLTSRQEKGELMRLYPRQAGQWGARREKEEVVGKGVDEKGVQTQGNLVVLPVGVAMQQSYSKTQDNDGSGWL